VPVLFATNRGIESYRQAEIRSRTPLELVVMLYDGALHFAAEAREAIGRKDIAARRDAVSRALAIVSELQSTLDLEQGGAIAVQLDGLYTFVSGRLVEGSLRHDARRIDEAVRVLTTLREGWAGIATGTSPTHGTAAK
jgi:flagellar protein FliS